MNSPTNRFSSRSKQNDTPPTKETVLTTSIKNSVLSSVFFKEKIEQIKLQNQRNQEINLNVSTSSNRGRQRERENLTLEAQTNLARHCFMVFRTRRPDAGEDDDDINERLYFCHPSSGNPAPSAELHASYNLATRIEGCLNVLNQTYQPVNPVPGSSGIPTRNHTFVIDTNLGARIGICKRDILVFALCCKNIVPKSLIREHVSKLAKYYELGNGPIIDIYDKKCKRNEALFEAYVKSTIISLKTIANQFLVHPDRAFYPLTYCEFPQRTQSILIGASQILESCIEIENRFYGGCILCDQTIICNHLEYDILQWVLHKNQLLKSNNYTDEEKIDDGYEFVVDLGDKDTKTDPNVSLNEFYNPPSPTDSINSGFDDDNNSELKDNSLLFQSEVGYNDDLLKEDDTIKGLIEELQIEDKINFNESNAIPPISEERIVEMLEASQVILNTISESNTVSGLKDETQRENFDYIKSQMALIGTDGSRFHASYIYLEKEMIDIFNQNIYSTYDLKKLPSFNQGRYKINHDSSSSSILSSEDTVEGLYIVLVIISVGRISLAALYSKETVLSENFIESVVYSLHNKLSILEKKYNTMKDILSNTQNDFGYRKNGNYANTPDQATNYSSLLYDRYSHELTQSTSHPSQVDSLVKSIVPVRGIIFDDFSTKVILKKSDEVLYGKMMFESEIYEKIKFDKQDIPIEKVENMVRKHIREGFQVNII